MMASCNKYLSYSQFLALKANIKLHERIQRAKSRGVAPPGKRIIHFNTQDSRAFLKRRNTKNTNRVRLTRYSLLSWAPLSLFYQFKRISNVYFLLITILTYMPFSPKVIYLIKIKDIPLVPPVDARHLCHGAPLYHAERSLRRLSTL